MDYNYKCNIFLVIIICWYKESQKEMLIRVSNNPVPSKEDIVSSYINAINKESWIYIEGDYDSKEDVMEHNLGEYMSENFEVYSVEKKEGRKKYDYYFVYAVKDDDKSFYCMDRLSYFNDFSCFQSMCSGKWTEQNKYNIQNKLDSLNANFLYTVKIDWPMAFIPQKEMTKRKEQMINVMKEKIQILAENIYGSGLYKVYIWDFSDSDERTEFLLINKNEKIMAKYPINFFYEGRENVHIPLGIHIDIQNPIDYTIGGVKYYELYQRFAISEFEFSK